MELVKSQVDLNRYIKFIDSRPTREYTEELYTESHHIIPKALGGSDGSKNKVRLTAREHFIAHLLLWKAFEGKMTFAFWYMSHNKRKHSFQLTSKQYANLKESMIRENIKNRKGKPLSKKTKQRISDSLSGVPHTEKRKENIRKSHLGQKAWNKGLTKETDIRLANSKFRAASKGKFCITNGSINKYVISEDEIPEGFWRGMNTKGKHHKGELNEKNKI